MEGHYEVVISLSEVEASDLEDDKLHDDIKAVEKHTPLHSALSELVGDFDGESMLFLQRFFRTRVKPVVSIGSLKLDLSLGIGGLPKGIIVEVYGQEGSCKTTLALNNALDPLLLETVGVNTKSLLISQPNSAENLLSIVDTLAQSGGVDVIVINSVATLIPQREITCVISDNIIETQSRIMTRALRKILYFLCRSDTLIIFINQVRSNLRSRQEGLKVNEVTCDGNALPFYSAVSGLGICVEVVKNKLALAMKKAELEIEFGRGISRRFLKEQATFIVSDDMKLTASQSIATISNFNAPGVPIADLEFLELCIGEKEENGTGKEYPLEAALEATKNTLIQGSTKLLLDFRVVLDQELGLILKLRDMMIGWIHEGF
ncbi:unnamed protein product [Lactuca virosa]|uniref:RecA-like N-terminal domain-containing protein n=1 Tax=Lactuca virosa TaxID=75947 RepID=A0AAU9MJ80_9ASTR|nr:unnamed protein product [Lactuca virosa]